MNSRCHILFSLLASFVRASEWSESIYSARRLQLKELLLTDVLHTKNVCILVDRERHYSTWPIFGLPHAQECEFTFLVRQTKSLTNLNKDMIIAVVITIQAIAHNLKKIFPDFNRILTHGLCVIWVYIYSYFEKGCQKKCARDNPER